MGSKAVICAMQKELDILSAALPSSGDVRSALSGIGKVNAALATAALIREDRPDAVISIGCAGSFAEGVGVGDIIIASETAYHDVWCGPGNEPGQVQGLPCRFRCDETLVEAARASIDGALCGLVISGDQFYVSPEEDERQRRLFPDALAADMESAAIAQTCRLLGVPFISIRAISDIHGDGRQGEHYRNFWDGMAEKALGRIADFIGKL